MIEAHQYALDVLSGKEVAGRLIKKACERFLRDLERTDIYFDEEEANKMIVFGEEYCLQWEGDWRGKPFKFEPWQKFIFQQLYGWLRRPASDMKAEYQEYLLSQPEKTLHFDRFYVRKSKRRFNKTYIQVSKKNGKSSICGVLSLFHLFADERVNTPKVFTAANNEDQAKICVNIAGKIVKESPELYEYVEDRLVKLSTYGINITEVIHQEKDGFIKALSKESDDKKGKTVGGKHGINASLGVVDEFGMSPTYGASKTIETSMASRMEYLMAYITTSGFNKDGPCFTDLRAIGIKVLDQIIEMDNYLPIIFEIDEPVGDDGKPFKITCEWLIKNEWAWKQSNPNLNVSVYPDFLRDALRDAAQKGGSTEVEVMTLNFNFWMDSPEVWISADDWNKNTKGVKLEELEGYQCFGGLEILSGLDLNALVLVFPYFREDCIPILPLFWMPAGKVIVNKMGVDCSQWVKDGFIVTTPGNVIDKELIYLSLLDKIAEYNLHSLAFNKTLETDDVLQGLAKNNIEVNPISQGYSGISTPTKLWEELFNEHKIEHFNNPVLTWMNANCMVIRDKSNQIKVQKDNSMTAGISAGIHALAQWKIVEASPDDEEVTMEMVQV